MKIYCILREKIWNLNFNKLWKPRSIFFCGFWALLSITFVETAFSCPEERSIEGKNRKKMKIKKLFADFEQNFWKCFQNCTQHVRRGILSWYFWKLHLFPQFCGQFFPTGVKKKQSSCPEKELCQTKFEKGSKIKQFFSDFDQNVSAG